MNIQSPLRQGDWPAASPLRRTLYRTKMTAVNLQNKKRSAYSPADLAKLDASLDDYWNKSRDLPARRFSSTRFI